jgi:hypothetical protein
MMPAPLAPGLVGDAPVQQPGRGRRRNACRRGPMRFGFGIARGAVFAAVLGLMPLAALAQAAKTPAVAPAPAVPEWRRTDAYVFGSIGDVTRRMQFVAQAMQLRDWCADRRVPDDFVRERLQRFGRMTGREESCTTLLDY